MQRMTHLTLPLIAVLAFMGIAAQAPARASVPQITAAQAPLVVASRPQREIFGFALAGSLNDPTIGYRSWNFSLLSTVAYFGIHVQDDGTFAGDSGWTIWNSPVQPEFVKTAHASGTKVVMTIVLQDFGAGTPHMCAGLIHSAATVGYVVSQVKGQGIDGVNVDYEGLNGSCGNPDSSWARHAFTNFVAALRSALPPGSYVSVDTYASSAADPLGFFDIPGLAPSVDSFFVMAYDLEYSNYSKPPLNCTSFCLGPTAPLTGYYYNATSTTAHYLAAVPASKVILGVPYYGRKACVGGVAPNQYPVGAVVADGYLDASTEATYYAVKPGTYVPHRDGNDPTGMVRWDTWDNTTIPCTRMLYWDDAAALGQKYNLVNQTNLRGVGIWALNYGGGAPELWNELATHFSLIPGVPSSLKACAGTGTASLSWAPASTRDGPITSYQVTASPGGATVTVPGTATFATLTGLIAGTAYTVTVQGVNSNGPGVGAVSSPLTPVAVPVYAGYFSWFDNASPGMTGDNIHILNPGGAASSGCAVVSGKAVVPFNLAAGAEQYVSFPPMTIGGPVVVTVNSGPAVMVSQRVQYYQSFNEVWAATAAQSATTSYVNWFDNASVGMVGDNIHVVNPGGSSANVTVSLPGAAPLAFSVAPGAENHVTFPGARIGGPVTITSSQPVLASGRVQYYQSFNEVIARSAAQASLTSYFNWFDKASPGMNADNIHVLNPGAAAATVKVSIPGVTPLSFTVAPAVEAYLTFPSGTIGGPVAVTSSQPILASQRVQFNASFNEVAAIDPAQAATVSRLMWFDRASPGMVGNNIHIVNTSAIAATGYVSLPGASNLTFTMAPGQEIYVTWPAGVIGGPVTVNSNQPVLAAQRVQYYQSFNEVPSG